MPGQAGAPGAVPCDGGFGGMGRRSVAMGLPGSQLVSLSTAWNSTSGTSWGERGCCGCCSDVKLKHRLGHSHAESKTCCWEL